MASRLGGHDELVDEEIFGGSGRLVLGHESFEGFVELFAIFVRLDETKARPVRVDFTVP